MPLKKREYYNFDEMASDGFSICWTFLVLWNGFSIFNNKNRSIRSQVIIPPYWPIDRRLAHDQSLIFEY